MTGGAAVLATVGTLAAAWFAAGAYIAARDQARIAQAALIASDRPWVKVAGLSAPELEVRADAVILAAKLDVQNVGRSPAARTLVWAKLLPDELAADEAGEAERECKDADGRRVPFREALLFPDAGGRLPVHEIADMRVVAAARSAAVERDFRSARDALGAEAAEDRKARLLSYPLRAAFTLVGCVTYAFPAGRAAGRTAFIFYLYRGCALGPGTDCSFEMTRPAVFKGDALKVRELIGGTFAR